MSTKGVEAPDIALPDSSFLSVVTIEVDETGEYYGYLDVLVPINWGVDSVSYNGPSSGEMFYLPGAGGCAGPAGPWYRWLFFQTDELLLAEFGDTFEATVRIQTDGLIGSVNIAFLGAAGSPSQGIGWNGDPCTVQVEVIELNLEQTTWGSVKTQFGNQ